MRWIANAIKPVVDKIFGFDDAKGRLRYHGLTGIVGKDRHSL